jgi:hypothetical protein
LRAEFEEEWPIPSVERSLPAIEFVSLEAGERGLRFTRGKTMALTRNNKETVIQRVQSDPAFAQALLDEAATLFLNGEPETARLILRDLVNATRGFEQFATLTAKPSKSQLPVVGA